MVLWIGLFSKCVDFMVCFQMQTLFDYVRYVYSIFGELSSAPLTYRGHTLMRLNLDLSTQRVYSTKGHSSSKPSTLIQPVFLYADELGEELKSKREGVL